MPRVNVFGQALLIIEVANRGMFTLKIAFVIAGSNVIGVLVFWRAKARRRLLVPVAVLPAK